MFFLGQSARYTKECPAQRLSRVRFEVKARHDKEVPGGATPPNVRTRAAKSRLSGGETRPLLPSESLECKIGISATSGESVASLQLSSLQKTNAVQHWSFRILEVLKC